MEGVEMNQIIQGDTLTKLKKLPSKIIDTIVTSPPYWGLRDYGVKGQIGLEPTLEEYINKLLDITAELKRVLKPTGVMFFNHGDCYANIDTKLSNYSISDNWLRLLGWIWTDGTVLREGNRICLYQTNLENLKEIELILSALNLDFTKHGPNKGNFHLYILAESSRHINNKLNLNGKKDLPTWLEFCSKEQILILLEAIIKGDGCKRKYDTAISGTEPNLKSLEKLLKIKNISCSVNQNSRGDWYMQIHQKVWNPRSLQPKCLALQNYRLILQMIDEQGWILRNTIQWHKPNSMPSSVKDRFANSYEPIFMLVKNKKYWFDLDAVRGPHITQENVGYQKKEDSKSRSATIQPRSKTALVTYSPAGKNPGDLWTIPTQPFPEAHFATFPEKLIEPMILAGCPEWICKRCGKARMRITKPTKEYGENLKPYRLNEVDNKELSDYLKAGRKRLKITQDDLCINLGLNNEGHGGMINHFENRRAVPTVSQWIILTKLFGKDDKLSKMITEFSKQLEKYEWQAGLNKHQSVNRTLNAEHQTIGWTDCGCKAGWNSGLVLDPFGGAMTTCVVAKNRRRDYLAIELNPEYIKIGQKRLANVIRPML